MHIILTGATGLVGTTALTVMLKDPGVHKITILSRQPVPQAEGHKKVEVIIQEDLAVYSDETLEKLKGAHGCIWAVGPPLISVSREQYNYAHIELPVIAAKIYATLNDNFNFVYVSHDRCHEARGVYILDVKARAEEKLLQLHHDVSKRLQVVKKTGTDDIPEESALPSLNIYSIGPALIDSSTHKEIVPWVKPPTMVKRLSNWVIIPTYRFLGLTDVMGTSQELGQTLADLVVSDGADLVVEGASAEGRRMGAVGMRNWCLERETKLAT